MCNPDEMIKKIYKHMSPQSWIAALATVISGYMCHIFILTNELFNHDDIGAWLQPQDYVLSTRWLQSLFMPLVSPIGSGVVAGTLTIFIIAISALILVDTLQIQSKVYSAIIGIMMIVSPIVASFMSYVNGSYQFCVGIPFAILAVRWYEKGIKGYVASCLALMCAIAGYQSNISITVAVFYIVLFGRLLDRESKLKDWWIAFAKAAGVLVIGLLLYFASNKIVAGMNNSKDVYDDKKGFDIGFTSESVSDTSLEGYDLQKIAGVVFVSEIPYSIEVAYKYWIKYNYNLFFDGANKSFASRLNVMSSLLLSVCSLFAVFLCLIKQKCFSKKLMILILLLVMPVCFNFTQVILNGKFDETLQMMYSMVLTSVFVVLVIESVNKFKIDNRYNCILFISVVAFIMHIYGNNQIVNDAYLRMNSQYEAAYGEICRVIGRIEELPEWQSGNRKIYFETDSGYLINENYQAFVVPYEKLIDMGWMGVIGTQIHNSWSNKNIGNFIKGYMGLCYEEPSSEEVKILKESNMYDAMERYPSINSIKVINDIVVVRL